MDISQRGSSTPPQLRIFSIVVATLTYCIRNAGRLFLVAWFPCLLASACQFALERLILAWLPGMPHWLLSNHIQAPTWLAALVVTPWEAMAWAFVLSYMSERSSNSGVMPTSGLVRPRFEASRAVFLAAAILSLVGLIEGMARFARFFLLIDALQIFELPNTELDIWAQSIDVVRFVLIASVMAWLYTVVGHVLRSGRLDIVRVWRVMRGNRLRLIAIFTLLFVALTGLNQLIQPATTWLANALADSPAGTLQAMAIRYSIDFPYSVLWVVVWAVTVGIVLDALEASSPSAAGERPTAKTS